MKAVIYKQVAKALNQTFGITLSGSFDTIDTIDKRDVGMLSIRKALDGVGRSMNNLTPDNTGVYLSVTSASGNNIIAPIVAMMMASFAGDEHLDEICSDKVLDWVSNTLTDDENWYTLMTSMLLRGLSPFHEYDSTKVNKPIRPSVLSYDQREEIKRILKIIFQQPGAD